MFNDKLSWLLSLFMALAVSPGNAQNHYKGHHHEEQHHEIQGGDTGRNRETSVHGAQVQGAHIHGSGELLVILEGEQLDIELLSPAMNLLGFEHLASNPGDQAKVKNVKETLADGDSLFQLDSAHCQLIEHRVDFSGVVKEDDVDDTKQHDEEHEAGNRNQHSETPGHSDIEARYRYRCERPGELRSLSTTIPTKFPGIQSLEVQWVVNGRQGAGTLDNSRRHLNFR